MSFLPPKDLEYLNSKQIVFQEIEDGGKKGVVLKDWALPAGRFDIAKADVLILLPAGYPDVAPDMFYLLPWAKVMPANCYPRKADKAVAFAGQSWQRWSRHNKEWRPNVDGIWTMIKRIGDAIEKAAA
jgi:hypothetical protein